MTERTNGKLKSVLNAIREAPDHARIERLVCKVLSTTALSVDDFVRGIETGTKRQASTIMGALKSLCNQDDPGRVLCEVLAGTDLSVDDFIRDIETGMEANAVWESPPKPVNER